MLISSAIVLIIVVSFLFAIFDLQREQKEREAEIKRQNERY